MEHWTQEEVKLYFEAAAFCEENEDCDGCPGLDWAKCRVRKRESKIYKAALAYIEQLEAEIRELKGESDKKQDTDEYGAPKGKGCHNCANRGKLDIVACDEAGLDCERCKYKECPCKPCGRKVNLNGWAPIVKKETSREG